MNILVPIIKLVISSLLLFSYYLFFLKDRQHHLFNRIYLLGLVFLSIAISIVHIPVSFQAFTQSDNLIIRSFEIVSGSGFDHEAGMKLTNNTTGIDYARLLTWIYCTGILVNSFFFAKAFYKLLLVTKLAKKGNWNQQKIYFTDFPGTPFTFLNRIFLPSGQDVNDSNVQLILQHESWHVQDRHCWDILFLELVKIVFWFNPVFFLVKRELMTVHEFIADEHVAPIQGRAGYAEYILMHGIDQGNSRLQHYFFHQPIKRRILMLVKNQQNKSTYWTRLAVLPLVAILFLGFVLSAQKDNRMYEKTGLTQDVLVCIDAGHGGQDGGATGVNGILESDLNLAIAKKIESLSVHYPVKVVLTRTSSALPGNETEIAASLRKRVEISKNANAAIFVSIHMAAGNNDHHYSIYVPNQQNSASNYSSSIKLGNTMVSALKNGFPVSEQLIISNKNIWVLNNSPVPAILLECGNINNATDLGYISDPANQEKLAKTILEAIVSFASSHD